MKYNLPGLVFLKVSKLAIGQLVILLLLTSISNAKSKKVCSSEFKKITSSQLLKAIPINIKGRVTDRTTGEILAGVTVKIKNTTVATQTDVNGNYSLNDVPDNAVLVMSYIGYVPIETAVKGNTIVNGQLLALAKNLNEVVVVGYGTQKKTSVTGAISTLKTADIAMKPVVNITNSLIGRVSGVISTQGSGEPGFDGSGIQIRGVGSIGGSAPLFIVDGVPRDFSRLDPNSIATLTVLKDAAAVAPYGVAGANGVILITTKQGNLGAPVLSYNGYVGIQNPTRVPTFVNSYQYALMANDAAVNDGLNKPFTDEDVQKFKDHSDPDGHPDGQPVKDIIKPNRLLTYHNLSLSGGSSTFRYFTSLAYTHQDGMWDPTYLDKYNATLNLTANATKSTTVNFTMNSWEEDQHFPSFSAASILNQAQRQLPTTPVLYSNGLNAGYLGQSLYGEIYYSGYSSHENRVIQSQFSIEQKLPLKGLKLKGVVSYDITPQFSRAFTTPIPFYTVNTNTTPYTYAPGIQGNTKPSFSESYNQNQAFTYQGILSYKASFGKSDVDFTGVVEARRIKYQTLNAKRINYNLGIDELDYGGPAATDATNGGSSSGQKQIGYVYRMNYAYEGKYLLEASGRYDGSYLFAPGNRFGFFPAFSAGWIISEENFMKNIPWIDNLKLRGSWGESGAYPVSGGNIQTYQYLSPYNVNANSAVINGSSTQGISEALQGNPNITWEKADKSDIGFEATLWNGLLSMEADYFYEKRSNMLVSNNSILPGEYGIGTGLINAGVMSNHGIDIRVASSYSFTKDLRLDVTGTFTFAQNKLLQVFENSSTYNNPNRRQTGRLLNTQFGLKALGYFSATDFNADGTLITKIPKPSYGPVHPGDIQYADLNNDGVINSDDQTVIGHPQTPGIIYGLEPHLTYKNFDLDVLFQGSANTSIALNSFIVWPFNFLGSATALSFSQYWTPDRTNTLYPRITEAPTSNNTQGSSWWIRNDAYARLKSAEIGYTFSNNLLHNKIKSLRIYAAAQNIFTWTPFMREHIDPENGGDDQSYYQQSAITIGINAKF